MAWSKRDTRLAFVGAGVVEGSLAAALSRAGYSVTASASRTFASARELARWAEGCVAYKTPQQAADAADFVFLTTPDDAIPAVAGSVIWRAGQGVAHCSGAASLDALDAAAAQGAAPGAFHPLQAVSSIENGSKSIRGITFGIEGGADMRDFLSGMARDLGANPIFVRAEDKPLYHLTGVMMGGLLTTLGAATATLWEELGYTRADGIRALMPMMRQVSVNLASSGLPGAVAGPYARGDVGTVRKHLEALSERAPDVLPLYCELALAGLPFSVEKGTLSADRAEEIRVLVERYKRGPQIENTADER